jgi:hypothetical protein
MEEWNLYLVPIRPLLQISLKVKAKLTLYRPWRPLGLREVQPPTLSDIRLIDGGKVVGPLPRPLFTPRKIPGSHFCLRMSRPQGHSAARSIRYIEKIHLIRDSNRRPSGLWHIASANYATACPPVSLNQYKRRTFFVIEYIISDVHFMTIYCYYCKYRN